MTRVYKTLRTYRFTDKDPVIGELQTMLQDEGLFNKLGTVAALAGVSYSTVDNLFHGATRRPQNATIMGIATAIGMERKWVKNGKLDLDQELKVAKAWNLKEEKRLAKLRGKK